MTAPPARFLTRRCAGLALATTLFAITLTGCGKSSAPAGADRPAAAAAERVLRRGNGAEIDSLDPPLAVLNESGNVLRDLYDGLVRIGPQLEPVPAAAERWEVSEDGRTYTFHLRANGRWSNGEPVTSEDFVASWRRLVDPKTASPQAQVIEAVVNAKEIVAGKAPVESLGVAAPDPRTLVVSLTGPAPYFPMATSHWGLLPTLHGQPVAKSGESVTNGAFVLGRRSIGTETELRRNPQYWNAQAVKLDAVRYVQIGDANDEYTRFRAGELDVTFTTPSRPLAEMRAAQGDAMRISPSLGVYYYGFNLHKAPFTSHEVRQALAMTVDRDRLVASITAGGELPAYAWVPTGMPEYTPQAPTWASLAYSERVAKARELLAKAGYGTSQPLRFELRYNTGSIHERIALAVASMWKEALGADVTLVGEEFKAMLQTIQRGDAQMFRSSWTADVPDAYSFLNVFAKSHELNLTGYFDEGFEADMAAAAREADSTKRRALLESAERRVAEGVAVIPLYYMVNRRLVSPRVSGWRDNAMRVVYSGDVAVR